MPKPNAFTQVAKRLASLQAKSGKMNEEIKALSELVDIEVKRQEQATATAAKPAAKAAPKPAPKASAKPAPKTEAKPAPVAGKVEAASSAAKKRGRPNKK